MDIVADLQLEMTHDVAAPPDHATVADANHRIGDHLLTRHHAGGDADVRPDEGVAAHADPALAEDGPRREGKAAAGTEGPEAGGLAISGSDGTVPGGPTPRRVDHRAEPTAPGRRIRRGQTRMPVRG
jgi:hypothetical protein